MHLTTLPFLEQLRYFLGLMLTHPEMMPADWLPQATTYDLPRYHSEAVFEDAFKAVVKKVHKEQLRDPGLIHNLLEDCGLPYDYARLGQPLSTVYELFLKETTPAEAVISFASSTKPFLSLIEARTDISQKVSLYCKGIIPLSGRYKAQLAEQNVYFYEQLSEIPEPNKNQEASDLRVYIQLESGFPVKEELEGLCIDAVTHPVNEGGLLFLLNTKNVNLKALQVIRKRTISALLPANALVALHEAFEIPFSSVVEPLNSEKVPDAESRCHALLSTLFPAIAQTAFFCTGLAAESAVFQAAAHSLNQSTPVKLYYAENGYGGTGQLIDEILPKIGSIEACALRVLEQDAQGNTRTLIDHFVDRLQTLHGEPVILFLETPTNPELQMHNFEQLMVALRDYKARYGTVVPVLVDTTMAPLYPLFAQDFAADWPFLIVKSGSKYFTKGKATLGVVMANVHELALRIMDNTRAYGKDANAFAKISQLERLAEGLPDLKERMAKISEHMQVISTFLITEMQSRQLPFTIYTMSAEQLQQGLMTGILSFYLPPAATQDGVDLVDECVAYMLAHAPERMKNRVSYGQSQGFMLNGKPQDYFYIINPEESTQGALSQEVKEAQKKDNVQICRLSVPANCEPEAFNRVMGQFFELKYGPIV